MTYSSQKAMDDHIHITSLLTSTVTISISFFIFANLPQSHSQQHDTKYSVCNQPYNCGEVSNIHYPFWGDNRPHYCGGSDQFKLHCEGNQNTSMQIGSQNFRVLEINKSTYTVRMVRADLTHDVCSPQYNDTYLSPTLFLYPENMHNITIYYDCPKGLKLGANTFTCQKGGPHNAFYEEDEEVVLGIFPELENCRRRVHVPALQGVPLEGGGGGGSDALIRALKDGFEVNYTIADAQECLTCLESKGTCGMNDTAQYQFSCYCPDGSNALECSVLNPDHKSMSSALSCFLFKFLDTSASYYIIVTHINALFLNSHSSISIFFPLTMLPTHLSSVDPILFFARPHSNSVTLQGDVLVANVQQAYSLPY